MREDAVNGTVFKEFIKDLSTIKKIAMQRKDANIKKQEDEKFPLPIYPTEEDIFQRSKEETFDENEPPGPDQQFEVDNNGSPKAKKESDDDLH